MAEENLEKKFSIEDINKVAVNVERASNLIKGIREFDPKFASEIIENLRPYISEGNVVDIYSQLLQKQFEEETEKNH